MSKGITLKELADLVAPEQCAALMEAVAVQDGDIDPPSSWAPEIEVRAQKFIENDVKGRLRDFDGDDALIASAYCDVEPANFVQWTEQQTDWIWRIAAARTANQHEFERNANEYARNHVLGVVPGWLAEERAKVADAKIMDAIRAAMTADGAVVRATEIIKALPLTLAADGSIGREILESGARRKFDRAELLEAKFDIVRNTITVGGTMFSKVQVELPGQVNAVVEVPAAEGSAAQSQPPPEPLPITSNAPLPRSETMVDVMAGWFRNPDGGGIHRYSPHAVARREFKQAYPVFRERAITRTSIGQARAKVGWQPLRPPVPRKVQAQTGQLRAGK